MTITSINYTKTYNLGSYQSEKIGIEISINEGENAMQALDEAKKLAQEFHEKNNPLPFVSGETIITPASEEPLPEIKVDKKTQKEQQLQNWINLINEATTIPKPLGLMGYETVCKNNPILKEAFDKKLKLLQDATS